MFFLIFLYRIILTAAVIFSGHNVSLNASIQKLIAEHFFNENLLEQLNEIVYMGSMLNTKRKYVIRYEMNVEKPQEHC